MSGAYTVPTLLFALDAVGVVLELSAAGDGLKVTGTGRPPADLLAAVKALKPDLLEHLKGTQVSAPETAKPITGQPALLAYFQGSEGEDGGQPAPPTSSPGLDGLALPNGRSRQNGDEAFTGFENSESQTALQVEDAAPLPDWGATAAQPGHCGSCARSRPAAPEWGPGMVVCTCDPAAWWPLCPPFALHFAARCGAYLLPGEEVGSGWRAKSGGKRWGAFFPSPEASSFETPLQAFESGQKVERQAAK